MVSCEGREDVSKCQFDCEMTLGRDNDQFVSLLQCMSANDCFPEVPEDGVCLAGEEDTVQEIQELEQVAGDWWVVRGVNCGQDKVRRQCQWSWSLSDCPGVAGRVWLVSVSTSEISEAGGRMDQQHHILWRSSWPVHHISDRDHPSRHHAQSWSHQTGVWWWTAAAPGGEVAHCSQTQVPWDILWHCIITIIAAPSLSSCLWCGAGPTRPWTTMEHSCCHDTRPRPASARRQSRCSERWPPSTGWTMMPCVSVTTLSVQTIHDQQWRSSLSFCDTVLSTNSFYDCSFSTMINTHVMQCWVLCCHARHQSWYLIQYLLHCYWCVSSAVVWGRSGSVTSCSDHGHHWCGQRTLLPVTSESAVETLSTGLNMKHDPTTISVDQWRPAETSAKTIISQWWWVRLKSCLTCKNRFKLYVTFNYQRTKTKIEFPYLLQRFAGSEQEWSEQIVGAILCIGVQERCLNHKVCLQLWWWFIIDDRIVVAEWGVMVSVHKYFIVSVSWQSVHWAQHCQHSWASQGYQSKPWDCWRKY